MQDWRIFRPAIWLAMLGIALMLLLTPAFIGAAVIGGAIGIALKIETSRRRMAPGPAAAAGTRARALTRTARIAVRACPRRPPTYRAMP